MSHIPYMIIIYTRFAGPTNTRGSRIVATATYFGKNSKVEHNKDDALSSEENHLAAAMKFLAKHTSGLHGVELIGQSDNPTGSGMAFVFKRVGV
jgi:hypothetical protein